MCYILSYRRTRVTNIKPVINRNTDLDNVDYLGSIIVLKKYTGPNETNGELLVCYNSK